MTSLLYYIHWLVQEKRNSIVNALGYDFFVLTHDTAIKPSMFPRIERLATQ